MGLAAAASAVPGLTEHPRPTTGAAGGWGEAGGIPLLCSGFPTPRSPRAWSAALPRREPLRAAQPVPPAPAGGGGGGAARTGTRKEVTFKPRALGDQEEGWGDGGELRAPGRPPRALAGGWERVRRRSSNKNID